MLPMLVPVCNVCSLVIIVHPAPYVSTVSLATILILITGVSPPALISHILGLMGSVSYVPVGAGLAQAVYRIAHLALLAHYYLIIPVYQPVQVDTIIISTALVKAVLLLVRHAFHSQCVNPVFQTITFSMVQHAHVPAQMVLYQ